MIRVCLIFVISISHFTTAVSQDNWKRHASPVKDDLHNVFFASDSVGWIITQKTGTILHTEDGGENWVIQAQMDSVYFEGMFFLNEREGWISGQNGLVYKTVDGGKTWEKQKISGDDAWIYSIYFHNESKGLAVGLHESGFTPLFQKTIDGGKHWIDISNKVPTSFYDPIYFLTSKKGFVAGGNKILKTENGGMNWDLVYSDTTTNNECREAIRGLTFENRIHGWAVGHCGLVLNTGNGDKWHRSEKFTKNRLRDIAFINTSEGFIVGDSNKQPGVLHYTTDGGNTWETILENVPNLHRIELTSMDIWIIGDNGTILSRSR